MITTLCLLFGVPTFGVLLLIAHSQDKQNKPFVEYNMRTHQLVDNKLYLYEFGDNEPNGYYIRQEIAHDLTLRGLPMTSFIGVRGMMFIDKRGAGIVMGDDWNTTDDTIKAQVITELAEDVTRRLC